MLLDGSVTYEFQSLDYDTCTQAYIVDFPMSDYYEFDSFNIQEQVTDEGVY